MLVVHRTLLEELCCVVHQIFQSNPPNRDIWYFNREMAAVNKCQHLACPAVSISPLSMDGLDEEINDIKWWIISKSFCSDFEMYFIKACLALLHLTLLSFAYIAVFFPYTLKVCGNPALSVYPHYFSSSICSLCVSLSHFGNPHIFQAFSLLYLLW